MKRTPFEDEIVDGVYGGTPVQTPADPNVALPQASEPDKGRNLLQRLMDSLRARHSAIEDARQNPIPFGVPVNPEQLSTLARSPKRAQDLYMRNMDRSQADVLKLDVLGRGKPLDKRSSSMSEREVANYERSGRLKQGTDPSVFDITQGREALGAKTDLDKATASMNTNQGKDFQAIARKTNQETMTAQEATRVKKGLFERLKTAGNNESARQKVLAEMSAFDGKFADAADRYSEARNTDIADKQRYSEAYKNDIAAEQNKVMDRASSRSLTGQRAISAVENKRIDFENFNKDKDRDAVAGLPPSLVDFNDILRKSALGYGNGLDETQQDRYEKLYIGQKAIEDAQYELQVGLQQAALTHGTDSRTDPAIIKSISDVMNGILANIDKMPEDIQAEMMSNFTTLYTNYLTTLGFKSLDDVLGETATEEIKNKESDLTFGEKVGGAAAAGLGAGSNIGQNVGRLYTGIPPSEPQVSGLPGSFSYNVMKGFQKKKSKPTPKK